MSNIGGRKRSALAPLPLRAVRTIAAVAALLGLVAGVPANAQDTPSGETADVLILSNQARRFLTLQSRSMLTEFLGCMIGAVRGDTVLIERIAPADVDPWQTTLTWVVPQQTCEAAGWKPTVGVIHSHPTGERCWYFFPGGVVPTSDGHSFMRTQYPVDAILCRDQLVWINRRKVQRQFALAGNEVSTATGRSVSSSP